MAVGQPPGNHGDAGREDRPGRGAIATLPGRTPAAAAQHPRRATRFQAYHPILDEAAAALDRARCRVARYGCAAHRQRGYGRGVVDSIFADRRLAGVYDAFGGDRDDLPAYLGIAAEFGAHRVLDIGCGTGCLALLLAAAGCSAVAVDPAGASLDVARAKDPAAPVTWIHGDATAAPRVDADLAVMTGNVAQVFLTDDDWTRALTSIRAALRPGGRLVFETRRPERQAWRQWAADTDPVVLDVAGSGRVARHREVTDVRPAFVSFRYTYRFLTDGAVITSDSTLRFRSRDEVESSLTACGYRLLDVRDAPDRPGDEFVFIAQPAG